MASQITVTPNQAGLNALLREPGGGVDLYLSRTAQLVARIARTGAPVGPTVNPIGERRRRTEPRLKDTIIVVPNRGKGGYEIRATASYAAAVHQGSKPHVIKPRRPNTLLRFAVAKKRETGQPGLVFAKKVNHPGHPEPNPFLLRALQEALR